MSTRNLTRAAAAALSSPTQAPSSLASSRASKRAPLWGLALFGLLALGASAVLLTRGDEAAPNVEANTRPIDTWVWHFDPELARETAPFYRDLLGKLPREARVLVMVADPRAESQAKEALGTEQAADPRLRFLPVRGPIGAWARDFYTPFDKAGTPTVLGFPRASILPREQGVLKIPSLLAGQVPGLEIASGSYGLVGGDLLLSSKRVLLGASTVRRLVGGDASGRANLAKEVEATFGRTLLVVGAGANAPYFHLDMFLTVLDDARVVLGDPTLALAALAKEWGADGSLRVRDAGTFRRDTQKRLVPLYRSLAAELEAAGFQVHRMPILHGERPPQGDRPETVLNWNNVVLERRAGVDIAYIPRCGLKTLDAEAARLWRALGYDVRAIDCRATIGQGGAVHCLTNDLRGPLVSAQPEPQPQ